MRIACGVASPLLTLTLVTAGAAYGQTLRYPTMAGQTRVEVHLMPAVSTGPLDPVWSPDGEWIAFSMRGDIWKIPSGGGEAVALTQGPGYHFEPAWSPDGTTLALSVDVDGNLDIGTVSAQGGAVERHTTDPHVDVQPSWSADGRSIYFVTGRQGSLDIYRLEIPTGRAVPVVTGRGHQIQPSVSPSGDRLAFISPVRGLMGSGGITVKELPNGETSLVHYEETSYRAKPQWTPDGASIVYVSDAAGSNDIALVPSTGGNRVRLTDHALDEYSPVVSPNGETIAFVSNAAGPTVLYTMDAGGGAGGAWHEVAMSRRVARAATGLIRGRVVDGGQSQAPARISLTAADGRAYTPDGGFHRVSSVNEVHYFHTRGSFEIEVPAGPVTLEATRGFEYAAATESTTVPAGGVVDVELTVERLADPTTEGWFSGDTHVHDLHQGRFGLTHEEFFYQLVADDLHVANDLIHMDGTKLMGRWGDLTGTQSPLSNSEYILYYAEEFRGSYGHVGLLGLQGFIMPLIGGAGGTPFAADVLKIRYLDEARAQGGMGGYLHPYNGSVDEPQGAAQADIPVHVALGRGDFFDVVSIASDELASAKMYYRMLNSGLRIPATGGTDNFSNAWRDPSGGTARTYARVDGGLSFASWIDAVRAGRTVATNGPLLFATVDEREPGSEIVVDGDGSTNFTVSAEVTSLAPVDVLEVIVNGQIAHAHRPTVNANTFRVSVPVELQGSGWIAVRVMGGKNRYIGDNYAFAQTTPVYIVRDGRPYASADDAQFLIDTIDELWSRVERRDAWKTPEDKARYKVNVDAAKEVYRRAVALGTTSSN